MSRPICVHCGASYGQRMTRTHQVRWREGEPMPRYEGNETVLKTSTPYHVATQETLRGVRAFGNVNEAELAALPTEPTLSASRTTWDGESWGGGKPPFCTYRCALDYARRAFRREGGPA